MKTIIVIAVLVLISVSAHSQEIKVTRSGLEYNWQLTNYALPDSILTYFVFDADGKCSTGGEMDAKNFYTATYFTKTKGKYIIEVSSGHFYNYTKKVLFVKTFYTEQK